MKTPGRSRSLHARKQHAPAPRAVTVRRATAKRPPKRHHADESDEIFDLSPIPMFLIALEDRRMVRVNDKALAVTAFEEKDLLARSLSDSGLISTADNQRLFEALHRDRAIDRVEVSCRSKEGRILDCAFSGVVVRRGKQDLVLMVAEDFSERQQMMEELRKNEDRYRRLVEISPEAIVVHVDGVLRYVNAATVSLFGASSVEEMIGKPVLDFVHPDTREFVRQRLSTMWDGHKGVPSAEERFLRVDGSPIDVEVTATPLTFEGRRAILVVARDITERKREREILQRTLEEKEVLLKEIHHRVKNNMQVISSLLNLQANEATDPITKEGLLDTQHRVRSMALVHEKLYRSGSLARIEFGEYLKSVTSELSRSYKKENIRETVDAENVFVEADVAIPCGLIVNEIVSNAFKHAFPEGRKGNIEVRLRDLGGGEVELCIEDDGVGIPASQDPSTMVSMGMKIVYALAEQISAAVLLERGNGTTFRIRFKTGSA